MLVPELVAIPADPPFLLGRTPVTNGEYAAFVEAGRVAAPPWWVRRPGGAGVFRPKRNGNSPRPEDWSPRAPRGEMPFRRARSRRVRWRRPGRSGAGLRTTTDSSIWGRWSTSGASTGTKRPASHAVARAGADRGDIVFGGRRRRRGAASRRTTDIPTMGFGC